MAYHLFCNDTSIVQAGYITIETKQAARIGNNTFFFVHRGLHLSSQVEKEPRYVQCDRFFYLNSTVFFLGYMMIIVPPYSDMGHTLYIPWILRINLFKPSNPSKIHGMYDLQQKLHDGHIYDVKII
jgi:hypothetical protein